MNWFLFMANYINISDLNTPELNVYTGLNEVQLKRFYEPLEGLFICESPKVIRRAFDAGYIPESFLCERKYAGEEENEVLLQCPETPVYLAHIEVLTKLTGYHLTDGMLCAMRRKPLLPAEELLKNSTDSCSDAFSRIVILDDIENPTNVGAIFRSAAAMKMDAVLLTEGCSDPLYRRAARVSMGNVFLIPWTYLSVASGPFSNPFVSPTPDLPVDDVSAEDSFQLHYIDRLHVLGYKTAALALCDDSVSIDDPILKKEEKLAVILGNEGNGLPEKTIAKSDYVVKIPMADGVDSLNVAAASAVAFWELQKR